MQVYNATGSLRSRADRMKCLAFSVPPRAHPKDQALACCTRFGLEFSAEGSESMASPTQEEPRNPEIWDDDSWL